MTHWYVKRYCTENYVSKVSVWPTSRFWYGKRKLGWAEKVAYREIARLDLLPNLTESFKSKPYRPAGTLQATVYSQREGKATDNTPSTIPVDSTYMKLGITRWAPVSVCDPDLSYPVHISGLTLTNSSWCPLPAENSSSWHREDYYLPSWTLIFLSLWLTPTDEME